MKLSEEMFCNNKTIFDQKIVVQKYFRPKNLFIKNYFRGNHFEKNSTKSFFQKILHLNYYTGNDFKAIKNIRPKVFRPKHFFL
jgi:hypothetical protein